MSVTHRVLKLGTLAVLAATVTGCIVLPYGGRGRHHHAVDRHHVAPSEVRPIMLEAPQQPRRSR